MIKTSGIRTLFCYLLDHNIFVLIKLGIRICFRKKTNHPLYEAKWSISQCTDLTINILEFLKKKMCLC